LTASLRFLRLLSAATRTGPLETHSFPCREPCRVPRRAFLPLAPGLLERVMGSQPLTMPRQGRGLRRKS
jgi:hypothetical protein